MAHHVLPVIFAVLLWWAGTGLIFRLNGRPAATFGATLALAGVAAACAFAALIAVRDWTTPAGAYAGFAAALVIWGWQELAFLLGRLTGPNRAPCPPGAVGWARFAAAARTLIWHELALAACLLALVAISWGAANAVGLWTFAILAAMRLSAKLNLYLGVRNRYETFLPAHLRHLPSYFGRRGWNALLPVSVAAGAALTTLLLHAAITAGGAFAAVSLMLLGAIALLGVAEHLFLMLPLPLGRLWRWGLTSRARPSPAA